MEEIKVNEYIRTELGDIKQITKGFEFIIERYNSSSNKIVKHSFNIIDLIEEGDYVNGYKIIRIDEIDGKDNRKIFVIFKNGDMDFVQIWENEDIKSIVTKEQFKSIEYEV